MGVLDGKVIIITGSTRGLGLAMARACAAEGARVVISSRSPAAVERAVAELKAGGAEAVGWACDVSDLAQVEALAAGALNIYGQFDVWINNAGMAGPYGPTMHLPPEDFLNVINTNILGTYHGSLVALRHFYPRRMGKLINILGRGDTGPVRFQNAYTASKIWVRSFSQALAGEYRDSGIGIYAYNPGLMLTEFMTDLRAVAGFETRLEPLKMVMRLWGNPPEIPAHKVVWLASAATDGKTGMVVRALGPAQLLGGVLREGARRLFGRAAPAMELHVATVTPAMPLHPNDIPASRPGTPQGAVMAGANGDGRGT